MLRIVQDNIFNDIVPLCLKDLCLCKIQKFQIFPLQNLKLWVKNSAQCFRWKYK